MKQSDRKEIIASFSRAEALTECREQTARENIRMIYLMNVATAVFSLAMGLYTRFSGSGQYSLEKIYGVFFVLSVVLFFFTRKAVRKRQELIPAMLLVNFFIWICCFAFENIFFRPTMYMCVMLAISTALCCMVLCFRMNSLKKVAEGERSLNVTALYRSIIDETQTGVYVRELGSYELLYMNRKAKEIFGIDGEENVGEKCYRLFYHQNVACMECPAKQRNMDSVSPREIIYGGRYYAVKGKIIDWCGREAYVEYLTDITDAKKVSEQMRAAHDNLQKKYEEEFLYREKAVSEDILSTSRVNLTQGIVEEMRVGKTDGYEKQYRHTMDFAERIMAFAAGMWLTKEQNERLSSASLLERYEAGETTLSEEYIAELKDGRHAWIRAEVNLVRRPETSEVMAFIYNRNVTREKLLIHVLECLMSFEYDEIYTVDETNGRFSAMAIGQYALDEQRAEGNYAEELACLVERAVHEDEKQKLAEEMCLEQLRRSLQTEQTYVLEVTLVSKSGKARRKQIRCMYLNKEVGILLITLIDIEDVVKAEKEKREQLSQALWMAQEANRAKSSFLASMSHEIRTPMNAIIGLNSMIKAEIGNCEQILGYSEKLDAASKYLLALLNDILDMSRIESGNMVLAHQPFDGDEFWNDVNTLAKAQADMAAVRYLFEREKEVSRIYIGDSTRLQQIMINLINNAIKFTPEEGYVKVSVLEQEEKDGRALIHVAVEDNGIGISEEFLPEVFGTFTQEHGESTTAYKGSGLGLSIAKNFAQMMDGDITVRSKEGMGTTFIVEVLLDIDKEKLPAKKGEEQETMRDFSGKKVLLVEDHPLNTIVAEGLLKKRGFEVTHAENRKEALRCFSESAEGTFDAVLMDIRMPVMDGIEATSEIRALERRDAKTVPIIAMTANAYEEDRRMTANAGMNAHLAKPIDPKQLFGTLDEFVN